MSKDYYDILNITKNASDAEIKKAYKSQAMVWHPDRNFKNRDKAEKKFKEISEAYQVLVDKDKRGVYDKYGKKGLEECKGVNGETAEEMFANMFGNLFGGDDNDVDNNVNSYQMEEDENWEFNFGNAANFMPPGLAEQLAEQLASGESGGTYTFTQNIFPSRSPKPKPIKYNLECTLEELYTGKERSFKITREGLIGPESRILDITVLPGWKTGTKITFKNEGNIKSRVVPSDIVFTVKQMPHKTFRRVGNNMITKIEITLDEALNGFRKRVKTISGTSKLIQVSKLKNSTQMYVIKGEGMPIRENNEHKGYGDLFVKFKVVF